MFDMQPVASSVEGMRNNVVNKFEIVAVRGLASIFKER